MHGLKVMVCSPLHLANWVICSRFIPLFIVSLVVQCSISSLNHLHILYCIITASTLPLPLSVRIYIQCIQYHYQACWPAILGLRLRRVLLCQSKVVLHGPRNQTFLENPLPYNTPVIRSHWILRVLGFELCLPWLEEKLIRSTGSYRLYTVLMACSATFSASYFVRV